MPGMDDLVAAFVIVFGTLLLFVETVPGAFLIEPSWLGLPLIILGFWRLAKKGPDAN